MFSQALPGENTGLKKAAWNARSLLHWDPALAQEKFGMLLKMLIVNDIVALQEVHGDKADMKLLTQRHTQSHTSGLSPHDNPTAGGVITYVKNDLLGINTKRADKPIVDGRVLRSIISKQIGPEKHSITIFNVHNFGCSDRQVENIKKYVSEARNKAFKAGPNHAVFVLGDFNFLVPGEARHHYGSEYSINTPLATATSPEA